MPFLLILLLLSMSLLLLDNNYHGLPHPPPHAMFLVFYVLDDLICKFSTFFHSEIILIVKAVLFLFPSGRVISETFLLATCCTEVSPGNFRTFSCFSFINTYDSFFRRRLVFARTRTHTCMHLRYVKCTRYSTRNCTKVFLPFRFISSLCFASI